MGINTTRMASLQHAGMTRVSQGVKHQLPEIMWLHVHRFCQEPGKAVRPTVGWDQPPPIDFVPRQAA